MKKQTATGLSHDIAVELLNLISRVPPSEEDFNASPDRRAAVIAKKTALKAAGVSGTLALPPGPLGLATILPDLMVVWGIQRQMIADIASLYGRTPDLRPQIMLYCLFKHGGAALVRDVVSRVGQRYLIRRTSLRTLQTILGKVGVRVGQRVIGKGVSRFIPVIGALAVGGYAYYDTTKVAATAIELLSRELVFEG